MTVLLASNGCSVLLQLYREARTETDDIFERVFEC